MPLNKFLTQIKNGIDRNETTKLVPNAELNRKKRGIQGSGVPLNLFITTFI